MHEGIRCQSTIGALPAPTTTTLLLTLALDIHVQRRGCYAHSRLVLVRSSVRSRQTGVSKYSPSPSLSDDAARPACWAVDRGKTAAAACGGE